MAQCLVLENLSPDSVVLAELALQGVVVTSSVVRVGEGGGVVEVEVVRGEGGGGGRGRRWWVGWVVGDVLVGGGWWWVTWLSVAISPCSVNWSTHRARMESP
jgi:hypothetical protein